MEVLTDLLLKKWKNFPEARQLGKESARFICSEMEATWGQSHLAILSEEEAQKWLLGVSIYWFYFYFWDQERVLVHPKVVTIYFKVLPDVLILRTEWTHLSRGICLNYSTSCWPFSGVPIPNSSGLAKIYFEQQDLDLF